MTTETITQNLVGKRILQLCADRNISIEELSQEVGLNEEQINQIIHSELLPSLALLIKIARVLGVRIGTFLDDNEKIGPAIQRKEKRYESLKFTSMVSSSGSSLDFFPLASQKSGRNMEPFIIDISPSKTPHKILSSHEGEEFVYILEGAIKVHYGKDSFELYEGDSIYFDSIVEHLVEAKNGEAAKVLAVLYTPV